MCAGHRLNSVAGIPVGDSWIELDWIDLPGGYFREEVKPITEYLSGALARTGQKHPSSGSPLTHSSAFHGWRAEPSFSKHSREANGHPSPFINQRCLNDVSQMRAEMKTARRDPADILSREHGFID